MVKARRHSIWARSRSAARREMRTAPGTLGVDSSCGCASIGESAACFAGENFPDAAGEAFRLACFFRGDSRWGRVVVSELHPL